MGSITGLWCGLDDSRWQLIWWTADYFRASGSIRHGSNTELSGLMKKFMKLMHQTDPESHVGTCHALFQVSNDKCIISALPSWR